MCIRDRDYIGDVESIQNTSNIFQNDKKIIIVACSDSDYDSIFKNKKDDEMIIVKANPLCEVYTQK